MKMRKNREAAVQSTISTKKSSLETLLKYPIYEQQMHQGFNYNMCGFVYQGNCVLRQAMRQNVDIVCFNCAEFERIVEIPRIVEMLCD